MSSGLFAGRYNIERVLGQGATATVHLARDTRGGTAVAIKMLRPELAQSAASERFLSEIRRTASLQHPRILPVLDSGEYQGQLYFVLPFMEEGTLRKRLDREKQLPIDETIAIVAKLTDALDYAHERGLIHRDVKPENILFSEGEVFLGDFGIARALEQVLDTTTTSTGMVRGTPAYMSPEQASGSRDLDGRSDVYSLACVVYEMLAGIPAFVGPTPESIISQRFIHSPRDLRVYRPTVSAPLEAAIAKSFALVPADRHKTAGEFARALSDASQPGTISMVVPVRRQLPGAERRYVVAAAIFLAVVGPAGFQLWRMTNPPLKLSALSIAVAPFDVAGPQQRSQAEYVTEQLSRNLDGLGALRTVPPTEVLSNWTGRGDLASARTLSRRTGAGLTIVGTIQPAAGDSVRLTGVVYDLNAGGPLGEASVHAHSTRLAQATDSLFVEILRILSRGRRIAAFRVPLGTTSLPAFKAYLTGEYYYRRTAWDSAQLFYDRAIELDSSFALAHRRLHGVQARRGSGLDTLVWFHAIRAGRLNRGLSVRDSVLIVADSLRASVAAAIYSRRTASPRFVERLFATLDVATRRFPDDPEVWYQLGLARYEIADDRWGRAPSSLDAFDHAIALDSAFGPAYVNAIELATQLRGRVDGQRYVEAYLAMDPGGQDAEAARVVSALANRGSDSNAVGSVLRSASAAVLFKASQPIYWWTDSTDLILRVVSEMVSRGPEAAAQLGQSAQFLDVLTAIALASRGRVGEAYEATLRWRRSSQSAMLADVAFLGGVPADSASREIADLVEHERWSAAVVMPMLAWWSHVGDSAALKRSESLFQARLTSERGNNTEHHTADYIVETSAGFLSLARGDSAGALDRLLGVRANVCSNCPPQGLLTARLAAARGRTKDAIAVLDRVILANDFPITTLLRFERAGIAERNGDRALALSYYTYVSEIWARGDSSTRAIANEANRARQRLAGAVR